MMSFLSPRADGEPAADEERFVREGHGPDGGQRLHEGDLQGLGPDHLQGAGLHPHLPDQVNTCEDEPLAHLQVNAFLNDVSAFHSDANFLRLHSDCGPNTVFKWQVKLR